MNFFHGNIRAYFTSAMVIFEHIFPKFLHNMVYNTKHSIVKKISFSNLLCNSKIWFHYVLKNANIPKKWLKWFLIFLKCVASIKHCDSIWLNKFVNHAKILKIIILQMGVFGGDGWHTPKFFKRFKCECQNENNKKKVRILGVKRVC